MSRKCMWYDIKGITHVDKSCGSCAHGTPDCETYVQCQKHNTCTDTGLVCPDYIKFNPEYTCECLNTTFNIKRYLDGGSMAVCTICNTEVTL